MKDLKNVYTAPTEEAALLELDKLEERWLKKYPLPIKSWKDNWGNLATFLEYPEENCEITNDQFLNGIVYFLDITL